MWLVSVVVRRYIIDILIIIITFPYSTCISSFLGHHPYFFVHLKKVFSFFFYISSQMHGFQAYNAAHCLARWGAAGAAEVTMVVLPAQALKVTDTPTSAYLRGKCAYTKIIVIDN